MPLTADHAGPRPDDRSLSVVIPVFDEAQSVPVLVERILGVARAHGLDLAQVILVDDGSRDGSWAEMQRLAGAHPVVTAIRLRRNFGKATAMNVGIEAASGAIVVTMDADLQDDPAELPRFVEMVTDGYDLVAGWRQTRLDPLAKTLPSWLFNRVTGALTGIRLHDFNCGYKAYRRELFDAVELYGELHRYVPVLAHSLGFRVGELAVRHHPRRFGRSKYGLRRFLRGFVDLITVLAITRYSRSPGHLFGGAGVALSAVGFVILAYLTGLKLITGADIGMRPLFYLGLLCMIVGLQVLLFGVLAELINSRTTGPAPNVLIRERVGGAPAPPQALADRRAAGD